MSTTHKLPESAPLWRPKNPEATPIAKYRQHINNKFSLNLNSSHDLHAWSISRPGRHNFWIDLWSYVGLKPDLPPSIKEAFDDSKGIEENPKWFEGVEINYAENVLEGRDLERVALIGLREGEALDGDVWTWGDLRENVRKVRSSLLALGVGKEDVVGVIMSNSNWAIAIFLATASLGAVFTSISPDMGTEGCVVRMVQSCPRVMFADSHQTYKAKRKSMKEKIGAVVSSLKRKPDVFIVPLTKDEYDFPVLEEFLAKSKKENALEYARVSFSYPMLILYSSGTSGPPKCRSISYISASPLTFARSRTSAWNHSAAEEDRHPPQQSHFEGRDLPILKHILGALEHHERPPQRRRSNDMLRRLSLIPRRFGKTSHPPTPQMYLFRYQSALPPRTGNDRNQSFQIRSWKLENGNNDGRHVDDRSVCMVLQSLSEVYPFE